MRGRAGGLVRIGEPGDAGDTGQATAGRTAVNTVEEDSARRTLLTLAVRDYGDGDAEFTAGIDEQLSVVADWWCAPGAPEPFTHVPAPELRERYDVERFLHESKVRETRGRALVVFITGHGQLGASRTHFLQLPRTEPRRQLATAIRTSEIVAAALDSRAEHVLVVINTCYAAGSPRSWRSCTRRSCRAGAPAAAWTSSPPAPTTSWSRYGSSPR